MSKLDWSFFECWNLSAEAEFKRDKKPSPRARIWASELGGAMVDRYLKMIGTEPTNPPNVRSLRKFSAGNLWEWIVGLVLKRAGLLLEEQTWLEFKYPDLLPVTGKLDYLAGGNPDWSRAVDEIKKFGFPDFVSKAAQEIVNRLSQKHPSGLKKIVLEVKSCSSFMFDKYSAQGKANPSNILQTYHYLKAKDLPEGHIVYICKDDCRMIEIGVFNPSPLEDVYKRDIEMITDCFEKRQQPVKEKEIEVSDVTGKFSANWRVQYSGYLKMLYGYKNQAEFENKYRPLIAKWNRVLQRCVDDKNMTKLNLEVIDEIKKSFPDFDGIVAGLKKSQKEKKDEK